ncbi:MAG: hypothetical protein ABI813_11420 [Bacteroidota bacterium]
MARKIGCLFLNGKNLDGWDIRIAGEALNLNYKNTFRVENPMLRIAYDEYKTFDDKYGANLLQDTFLLL